MKTIKIGRAATNDAIIPNNVVSSQHAVILLQDGGEIAIRDLNSTNGTYVNNTRVTGTHPLKPGDSVLLGNCPFDWQKAISDYQNKTHWEQKSFSNAKQMPQLPPDVVFRHTIGRSGSCNTRLDDDTVSSNHAILYQRSNGEVWIVDCGSVNGTFVNGARISSQRLRKGDKVTVTRRHPVDWERIVPRKSSSRVFAWIAAAVVAIAVVSGAIYWLLDNRPWEPEKIYAHYKKSVVLIEQSSGYVVTSNGKLLGDIVGDSRWSVFYYDGYRGEIGFGPVPSLGTGFFISRDGKIMTNHHVVGRMPNEIEKEEAIRKAIQEQFLSIVEEKTPEIYAIARNIEIEYHVFSIKIALNDTHYSSSDDLIPCTILKMHPDSEVDAAIIQINTKKTPEEVENIVEVEDYAREAEMQIGKKVYTIGFPRGYTYGHTASGLEANNQSGEITQERGEYIYGHNIVIQHGASGSPVFNEFGKFAGIIVSQHEINGVSTGYNAAVNPEKVVELVR